MELKKETVLTDREEMLIQKAKEDPLHFRPLYEKYHHQLYWFVFKKTHDKDLTGDIISNVFTKALINIKKFEFRKLPFSSWLYRIAINEVTDHFRRSNRVRMVSVEDCSLTTLGEEMQLIVDDQAELEKQLGLALQSLQPHELELIELRFFAKRSFKEIGEMTNQTDNNAKVKTYRILNKLGKKIKGK